VSAILHSYVVYMYFVVVLYIYTISEKLASTVLTKEKRKKVLKQGQAAAAAAAALVGLRFCRQMDFYWNIS
jgi:hypothetical protein